MKKHGIVEFLESRTSETNNRVDEKALTEPDNIKTLPHLSIANVTDKSVISGFEKGKKQGSLVFVIWKEKPDNHLASEIYFQSPREMKSKSDEKIQEMKKKGYWVIED